MFKYFTPVELEKYLMIKYLGTHNSGTYSNLVWWQRILNPILNLTSRCQTLSIEDHSLFSIPTVTIASKQLFNYLFADKRIM